MKQGASTGGFNDTVKIAFSGRQNDEKMLNESPIFPKQEFHEPFRSLKERKEALSMLDNYRSR